MQPQSSTWRAGRTVDPRRHPFRGTERRFLPCPERLGRLALKALLEEAELTPKPGLVDQRGSGSHHDLSLPLFLISARVLRPYFQRMAEEAQRESVQAVLRTTLGRLGREAESEMLKATYGTNTHRGAIWSLGLLTAAAATQASPDPALVCHAAGRIARLRDVFQCADQAVRPQPWRTHHAMGARSEAFSGFPHVLAVGLPVLQRARTSRVPENLARIDALLAIISTLPDTCILQRGGPIALLAVQCGAKRVLDLGGCSTSAGSIELEMLERTMLQLWVSPGGSADLLAATLFLDQLASAWENPCD